MLRPVIAVAVLVLAGSPAWAVRVSPRSADGRLDLSGYIHVQWEQDFRAGPRPRYGFVLRRARVEFAYEFDDRVSAELELSADRLELAARDAFISYRVGRPLQLTVGLRKMPFSRERLTPSSRLMMVERTVVNDEFRSAGFLGRDIGLTVAGELFERTLPVGYAFGVYNGNRGRFCRDNADGKQFVERVTLAPARWLSIGLNATQRNDSLTGRVIHAGGGDIELRLGRLRVETEFLAGQPEPEQTAWGGQVSGAYRLGAFEPGLRLERFVRSGAGQTVLTTGLNWHLHRRARVKANLVSELEPVGHRLLVEAQAGF